MKKNGFVASSLIYTFVVVFLGLMLFLLNSYYRVGNLADKYKLDIRTSLLDMMVWNEITKEYEKVKDVPKIGYYFESDYSYCENNSQLNYQNGIITLKSLQKDYCYAYFKKRDEDCSISPFASIQLIAYASIISNIYKLSKKDKM